MRPVLTRELLYEEYIVKQKPISLIAKELCYSPHNIQHHLAKHGIERREARYHVDITGQKFGRLTAIRYIRKRSLGKENVWECRCECGNTCYPRRMSLVNGSCSSCGCWKAEKVGAKSHSWRGGKFVPQSFLTHVKTQARVRKIPCEITIQDIEDILEKQQNRCALSGEELWFKYQSTNASVDRIDSSKTYTRDNIQIVTKQVNTMKHVLSNEALVALCKKIVEYNEQT